MKSHINVLAASSELDTTLLGGATMLESYKAQKVCRRTRCSRFLKRPSILCHIVHSHEKPQRIMALLMVMGLSLLVYALAERWVRHELKKLVQDNT